VDHLTSHSTMTMTTTTMMRIPLLLLLLVSLCKAFVLPSSSGSFAVRRSTTSLADSAPTLELNLSSSEQQVYDFMNDLHTSGFNFRTIVAGSGGAILESTQPLGSVIKVSESAKSGDLFLTMATEDQSFEFHIKIRLVSKISLVERELPGKTLRIIRINNQDDESMCSLILADYSDEAGAWFQDTLVAKYGNELVV
jgi:hypothetical protein